MLSWLLLLIAVPVVIVPVVLLCGFAGCGLNVVGTALPAETPDVPKARLGTDRKSVSFGWLPRGGSADSFEILRNDTAGNAATFTTPGTVSTFSDTAGTLTPGMTFGYRVRAISFGASTPFTNERKVTIPPAAPSLTAVVTGPTKFRLEHLPDLAVIYAGPAIGASHTIAAGTTHSYRVFAIVENGFDDSQLKAVESDPSATATATASSLVWSIIFSTAGIPANPANGQNAAGDCIVQRIPAPTIVGGSVRVSLRGIVGQATVLTTVTISKAAAAGSAQPQNSLDAPIVLRFAGATAVTTPNGELRTSDPVAYAVIAGQDLHVAFNVDNGSGRVLRRTVAGRVSYSRNNAADAASQNRPNYNTNNNDVYCVEAVEIA